jgi:4-diphosphocytidyl-2-C-methyl-D-erythritol kinase
MIAFPPCKINLGLNIVSKRADGYHNIITCFYPVPWTDILEIIPSSAFSFSSSGTVIPGKEEDNLCIKAFNILKADFGISPVKLHLHKVIPTGAGLGGGSSDAAYTLRLLNDIFKLNLSFSQLQVYATKIGSDCSFFLQDQPKLGTERGDVLYDISLSLKGKFLVLIKPDLHVSTADAYSNVVPVVPEKDLKNVLEDTPVSSWKESVQNDFEQSVFRKYPLIAMIKQTLYDSGAVYTSMSGSGSTVFGIFSQPANVSDKFKGMTQWSGELS